VLGKSHKTAKRKMIVIQRNRKLIESPDNTDYSLPTAKTLKYINYRRNKNKLSDAEF
jgi:hypothetical protein